MPLNEIVVIWPCFWVLMNEGREVGAQEKDTMESGGREDEGSEGGCTAY